MNNNSFLHHKWVDSPPPPHLNHNQAAGNLRERKAKLKSPRCALKFKKISRFHWMTNSCKVPVEDTHILTISLSAEGSVSCLHFKWLKP